MKTPIKCLSHNSNYFYVHLFILSFHRVEAIITSILQVWWLKHGEVKCPAKVTANKCQRWNSSPDILSLLPTHVSTCPNCLRAIKILKAYVFCFQSRLFNKSSESINRLIIGKCSDLSERKWILHLECIF
jgi:hypothetical protein